MAKSVTWLISGAVYTSCLELAEHARIPTSAHSDKQCPSEADRNSTQNSTLITYVLQLGCLYYKLG